MMEGDLLFKCYSNQDIAQCNAQVAEYVRLLSFKNPAMKVPEVGAGTGSATVPLLKAVSTESGQPNRPHLDRYVFTDISPGFSERAQELLAPWGNEYQKLYVDRSVYEQ